MKALVLLALLVVASAYQYAEEWEAWKKVSCPFESAAVSSASSASAVLQSFLLYCKSCQCV